jgi:branched-chain amino acid transport system substrate-binding protein
MKKIRWFYSLLAVFLVLSSFLIAGCGPKEPGVIKAGIVMTMSGPAAKVGTNVADGVKIAVKHWNDKGGVTVDGRQYTIELVEYDAAMKPEQGVSATKKLIEQDEVLVMFGDCISTVCLAQKPIIEEAGIPWITLGAHPDLTQDRKYTFRSNGLASEVTAQQVQNCIRDYGLTKWSLLAEEAALSLQVMEAIAPAIEEAGGTVLTQDTFPPGTVDFYPLLTKLKKAAPEVVNIQGSGDAVTILKQANEIGFKPQWMVSTQVPVNQLIEQIGGELTAGVWQIVMYDPESDRASIKQFNEEAQAYLGRPPSLLETLGYEGTMRMFMAIELANSLDREEIVQALYEVDWDGVYFVGKYHANGEGTVGATTMQMTAEGTYVPIE